MNSAKLIGAVLIAFAFLATIPASQAENNSKLEDCSMKYARKARTFGRLFVADGGTLAGAGVILAELGKDALSGAMFPPAIVSGFWLQVKMSNYFMMSSALNVAREEFSREDLKELRSFTRKVNKKLEDYETLDEEEVADMLESLVAEDKICRVTRVVKRKKNGEIKRTKDGEEKVKYEGWVMKPKKVRKWIRNLARAKAEKEAKGEEVENLSVLIHQVATHLKK